MSNFNVWCYPFKMLLSVEIQWKILVWNLILNEFWLQNMWWRNLFIRNLGYSHMALNLYKVAFTYSQTCFSDHLYSAVTCLKYIMIQISQSNVFYLPAYKPINLYIKTTCLMWLWFWSPLECHLTKFTVFLLIFYG